MNTTEIKITDVRKLKGDSAFLLDDGETAVLYDSGFGFTGFDVAENIKKVLGERKLDYIFLTHSHYDHALGSAYVLKCFPTAKVVAGRYAAEIFTRDSAKSVMCELDRKCADQCGYGEYEFLGDDLRVDIPCSDGDIINAGKMQFRVLNLPGHTKCSVGFYCEERKLLLSTETVGVFDGEKTILPSCLVGYKMTLESIERVEKLKIKRLLSPHYGLLDENQTSYFLSNTKNSAERVIGEILNSIKQGLTDDEIFLNFKDKYWHGYIKEFYPYDALKLNTGIMINLVKKELL